MENKKNQIIVYSIGILIVLIDQLSKLLIIKNMDIAQEIPIIPGFFSLFNIKNTGAAFSSFIGQKLFLIFVSIACIIFIINLIRKEKYQSKFIHISLGILIGGMIGNFIDRIFRNGVIDFISITIFDYKFPVFNIADICITCGVAIYIIISIIKDMQQKAMQENN